MKQLLLVVMLTNDAKQFMQAVMSNWSEVKQPTSNFLFVVKVFLLICGNRRNLDY